MARRAVDEPRAPRRRSPARTPEERESLITAKALNLIEDQIDDGTVGQTVLAIYAKYGSERERLEREKLRNENQVLKQKVKTMEHAIDMKNLMEDALQVFKGYSGQRSEPEEDEDYYDD